MTFEAITVLTIISQWPSIAYRVIVLWWTAFAGQSFACFSTVNLQFVWCFFGNQWSTPFYVDFFLFYSINLHVGVEVS